MYSTHDYKRNSVGALINCNEKAYRLAFQKRQKRIKQQDEIKSLRCELEQLKEIVHKLSNK